MAADEVMVYSAMALVPATAGIAAFFLWRAVRRQAISILVSCIAVILSVLAGMCLSFFLVLAFSHLLHGDGALAIIAAPITGAILCVPVIILFALALAVSASGQSR